MIAWHNLYLDYIEFMVLYHTSLLIEYRFIFRKKFNEKNGCNTNVIPLKFQWDTYIHWKIPLPCTSNNTCLLYHYWQLALDPFIWKRKLKIDLNKDYKLFTWLKFFFILIHIEMVSILEYESDGMILNRFILRSIYQNLFLIGFQKR